MIKEFLEGETYRNAKLDHDILVLGIGLDTPTATTLAILRVDRASEETTGGDELTVLKSDLENWDLVVL